MANIIFTNNGGINLPIYDSIAYANIYVERPTYYQLTYTIPPGRYVGIAYEGGFQAIRKNQVMDAPAEYPWTKTLINNNGNYLTITVESDTYGPCCDFRLNMANGGRVNFSRLVDNISGAVGAFMRINFNRVNGIGFVGVAEDAPITIISRQKYGDYLDFVEFTVNQLYTFNSVTMRYHDGMSAEQSAILGLYGRPNTITQWIYNQPIAPSENPYAPGGTSGTGGGNGTFDRTSDPIPFTNLPTLTAARAGMISLFNPTLSELQTLSARLWSKDFLDTVTNFFTDPSDIIISLGIVPVTPPISGRNDLQAGLISTGIEMNVVSNQFVHFNCGSVQILPFYDAALDYSPFTKISIFLPYIGVRQLNTDEVMNNTVEIQYSIDLFSGACVAEIKVGESVLYTFNGNVLSSVPVSSRSFDSLISAVINGATAIGGAIATGGATAGVAVSATVNAVQSAKPEILRSGNASANIGLLAGQTPYLIFEIPNQSMPENNQTFVGYPSNITAKLGDLTGFTQVDTIHLENIPATNNEITEIENLLRQGVIL